MHLPSIGAFGSFSRMNINIVYVSDDFVPPTRLLSASYSYQLNYVDIVEKELNYKLAIMAINAVHQQYVFTISSCTSAEECHGL